MASFNGTSYVVLPLLKRYLLSLQLCQSGYPAFRFYVCANIKPIFTGNVIYIAVGDIY